MLSTAIFEAAQTRIFDPRFTSCRIISTTVVVFPVPGGPCNKNKSFDERALEMASFLKGWEKGNSFSFPMTQNSTIKDYAGPGEERIMLEC